MNLRDYQKTIITEFGEAIKTHRRIVVTCPTGGGKTIIAVDGLLPLLPHPVAWVTHRRELASQIASHGTSMDVVMSQAPKPNSGYSAIIIDEGHHVCAEQYSQIISANPDAIIVALTATPYRMDGQGLGASGFTKIIYGPDVYTLTKLGYLCPANVFVPKSETQSAWNMEAVATAINATRFHQGIVYCRTVSDAHQLAKTLSSSFRCEAVDGETSMEDRDKITARFRSGKTKLLCNHTIFTEGYDLPGINLVVLNRLTMSRCLWRQMTGRGLRTSPGKTHCTILDLAGNGITHGSIYDREIFDLGGTVAATEERSLEDFQERKNNEYQYHTGEELKEWKPKPKPVRLLENLAKLRQQSPLHRFMTAQCGA